MKKITQNSLSTTFSVSFDCIFTNGTSAGIRRIIQPFLMIWLGCFLLSILTAKVFAQGQYTIIRLPGPGCGGAAFGLNESGDVVGRFRVGASCSLADHAFLYHAGVMTDLESSFSSGPQSSAYGVNRRLQVVGSFHESPGFRPFLWQSGAMSDILPSGSIDAIAYGINDAGLVVGNFIGILNPRGFIYDSNDGTTTLIGTSSSFKNMRAVNSNGDIVGYFGPALSGPHHAFLMPRGASLIDLGTVGFF